MPGFYQAPYVTNVYNLRKEAKAKGDAPTALLYKYLLNSLYGKFGQRTYGKWELLEKIDPLDWDTQKASLEFREECRWRDYPDGDTEQELADYWETDKGIWRYSLSEPGMGKRSVASVAAFITVTARAKLLYAMQQLMIQGDQVFMCDTDSIVTSGKLPNYMVGNGLGEWELEDTSPALECEFVAPKQYTFRGTTKCKGIRQPAQGNREYREPQFSKWSTDLLSTDPQRNARLEQGAMVKDVDKRVTGENRKRQERGYNRFNDPLVLNQGEACP